LAEKENRERVRGSSLMKITDKVLTAFKIICKAKPFLHEIQLPFSIKNSNDYLIEEVWRGYLFISENIRIYVVALGKIYSKLGNIYIEGLTRRELRSLQKMVTKQHYNRLNEVKFPTKRISITI